MSAQFVCVTSVWCLLLLCCAGAEAEYQAMQVLCLVATVEDDPQIPVASQVIAS